MMVGKRMHDRYRMTTSPGNLIHLKARFKGPAHMRLMDQPATSLDFPLCPNCVNPMVLARTWPRVGGLAEMHTYQCQPCNVVFTEIVTGAGAIPERMTVLHCEEFHSQH